MKFKRVIHLFENFKIIYLKMIYLDKIIRKKFEFKEFQMNKIEEFQILIKKKFENHSFSLHCHFTHKGWVELA